MNPRLIAAKCIYAVLYQGKSLTDVMQRDEMLGLDEAERALAKDICFGAMRWHYPLNAVLNELMVKPLKIKDKDVESLLRVGLYQIIYQETPDHAAVNETVKASKGLKKPWSRGLINGILRNFIRNSGAINNTIREKSTGHSTLPGWLEEKIISAWPEQSTAIFNATDQRAPMVLRVNVSRNTRPQYLQKLQHAGIKAHEHQYVDSAIELDQPVNVQKLPGFFEGAVSVQDASAQLAATLLDCHDNMNVLDACAAPGGKTGHLTELNASLKITAIDNEPQRLQRVQQNLDRLGTQARLVEADAKNLTDWYDGKAFDRILLDAPCSATGVIRRHPDIKVLRRSEDINKLLLEQQQLLEKLWSVVKPGGKILYATCSILPEENDQQISRFLDTHQDAAVLPIDADFATRSEYGIQILPGLANMDGFYYSLLCRECNQQ